MAMTNEELENELLSIKASFSSANLELTRRKADLDDDVIRDANRRAGMKDPTGLTGDPRNATTDTVGGALVVNAVPGVGYMDKAANPFDFWIRRGYSAASWEKLSFAGIVADAIGGGTIYFYDVTAFEPSKNVGAKTYQDGKNTIIQSSTSDTTEVLAHIRCSYPQIKVYDPRDNTLEPALYTLEPSLAGDNFFEGQIMVTLPNAGGLVKAVAVLGDDEDGSSDSTVVIVEQSPIIQSAIFTGGYPVGINNGGLTQTELKLNDAMTVRVVADQEIGAVQFENSGAFTAGTVLPDLKGTAVDVVGKIADRGNATQALGGRVRVQNATGSWSEWFDTASGGSTDAIHVVNLNNTSPYIALVQVTYAEPEPEVQALGINELSALAQGKTAELALEFSETSSFVITSPQFYLNFDIGSKQSPSAIERIQATAQSSIDFLSGNNISISGVRNANDALTIKAGRVNIQALTPSIAMLNPPDRYVSGGNDNTSEQRHTVLIQSSSPLLRLTMDKDSTSDGRWEMGGSDSTGKIWSGSLWVHDDDQKGVFEFENLVAVNWAGVMQNTFASPSGNEYTIGGFVERGMPIVGFANTATLNVAVIDPTKLVGRYESAGEDMVVLADLIGQVVHDANGKVMPEHQHGSGGTTFDALASNPTTVWWQDQLQADANTTGETLTIEELP